MNIDITKSLYNFSVFTTDERNRKRDKNQPKVQRRRTIR